jgi:hypothetical protein
MESLLQPLLETTIQVLFPVLLGFVVWAVKEGIEYIKANVEQKKLDTAVGLAYQLVLAAEQNGLADRIKDEADVKRDWVLERLEVALAKRGIKLDTDILYALVEAQVMDAFNREKLLPGE